jgi:hypothetical protein
MGDSAKLGGCIITTPNKTYISKKAIDQKTLHKIADLLGIRAADRRKLTVESIRTIFIHAPPDKSKKE